MSPEIEQRLEHIVTSIDDLDKRFAVERATLQSRWNWERVLAVVVGSALLAWLGLTNFLHVPNEVKKQIQNTLVGEVKQQVFDANSEITNLLSLINMKKSSWGKGGPVQPGTIVPFAGTIDSIPDGWLLCDGRVIGNDYIIGKDGVKTHLKYARHDCLIKTIKNAWGNGSVPEDPNEVNIPDLRGLFLRGVDHGRGKDPGAKERGDRVGTEQEDALKKHNHYFKYHDGTGSCKDGPTACWIGEKSELTDNGGIAGTADESRPKNAYVNWIIKY